jgi:hypothetical protein
MLLLSDSPSLREGSLKAQNQSEPCFIWYIHFNKSPSADRKVSGGVQKMYFCTGQPGDAAVQKYSFCTPGQP